MPEPSGADGVRCVGDFAALATAPFGDGINAFCWRRRLVGDHDELVRCLAADEAITVLDVDALSALTLSAAGRVAVAELQADAARLRELGLEPTIECVRSYPRDPDQELPTDVHSFHVDAAPVPADTWLCTYAGRPTEGLSTAVARRRTEDALAREALLRRYGGADGDGFVEWLREHHHDLHYLRSGSAPPFSFGLGHLWRIAVQHPASVVPACIHRAPPAAPEDAPRLLLIC